MIEATFDEKSVVVMCLALDCLADDLERTLTFAPHDADPVDEEIMQGARILRDQLTNAFMKDIAERLNHSDAPPEVIQALGNILDQINGTDRNRNDDTGSAGYL
jgi:hypothetical protein